MEDIFQCVVKRKREIFGEHWWNVSSWWDWFGTSIIQNVNSCSSYYLFYQRAAGVANRHDLVVRNWSPRKVMDLYLGVRHFFDFPWLSSDKNRRHEKISWKTYYNALSKRKGKLFGEQWWNVSSWWDWFGTSIIQNVNSCIYFHFSKIIDTNYVLG